IVIPPAIFFYYSTLFDSRFKTLQQNPLPYTIEEKKGRKQWFILKMPLRKQKKSNLTPTALCR
ncbi:hypothetical protein, partial [Enterococcus casseliflavus]|uniref:hypothetical protein n=1 Tax=Enterococcus casseliflavus TaxID=37734 RepID=UPI003D0C257C